MRYPGAVCDPDAGARISDAEVADITTRRCGGWRLEGECSRVDGQDSAMDVSRRFGDEVVAAADLALIAAKKPRNEDGGHG